MRPADCTFCEIAAGTRPAHVVLDDGPVLAFLDARPVFPGHTLVVTREHYETLLDLPRALLEPLFGASRSVARAMEEGLGADGSFVAVNNRVSQSVPHFHIHVVPRRKKDGLKGFFWPRQKYKDEAAMREVQSALRSSIDRLRSRPVTEAT